MPRRGLPSEIKRSIRSSIDETDLLITVGRVDVGAATAYLISRRIVRMRPTASGAISQIVVEVRICGR